MFVAGERSGPGDDADLCADDRGQGSIRTKPGRGAVFRVGTEEAAIGATGPAVGDQQGGRRDVAQAAGELRAPHFGGEGAGQRRAAMGIGVGASGGTEREKGSAEAGVGGSGAETGGAATPIVGDWGSVRAAEKSRSAAGAGGVGSDSGM